MILWRKHSILTEGFLVGSEWLAFDHYEIKVVPLKIKLTEQIYNYFYEFFFKEDKSQKSNDDVSKKKKSKEKDKKKKDED